MSETAKYLLGFGRDVVRIGKKVKGKESCPCA